MNSSFPAEIVGYLHAFSVAKSYLTICDTMDPTDPPGSSVHGISQARILEWVAISFFVTQGSNPHLLHWQAESLLLSRKGSRDTNAKKKKILYLFLESFQLSNRVIKSLDTEARLQGFKSELCHLLPVWPWASHLISLCPIFLFLDMTMTTVPTMRKLL